MSIVSDNHQLSYFLPGTNGRGVLLIHGITGAPAEMKYIARKLHRAGYTVFAPLLSGHGYDMQTLRNTRWQEWFASTKLSLEYLKSQVDEVFIAGMCVGGLLGLRVAYEDPSIKAIAIYSPALKYDGWNIPFYCQFSKFLIPLVIRLGLGRFFSFKERMPFGIKSERLRKLLVMNESQFNGLLPGFPLETILETYKLISNVKTVLSDFNTPTLLMHSRQDDLASPKNSLYIKEKSTGLCDIVWLENSYHMIHIDQERDVVAQRTEEFFNAC